MERTIYSPANAVDDRSGSARSGALAGAVSAFAFTVLHDILISDIWFSAVFMIVAGALCGLCIGWSYGLLVDRPSGKSWLGYNGLYVAMLMLLGAVSVLLFEPAMALAELMDLNGPPDDLIRQALPLTLGFTLISSALICLFYRRSWRHFGSILLTATVLVLLLGLNVSVLGLVSVPRGALYLVVEFLGLIVFINAVYVVAYIALEWRALTGRPRNVQPERAV